MLCRGDKKLVLITEGEDARADEASLAGAVIGTVGVDDLLGPIVVDTGGVCAPMLHLTLPPPLTGGGAEIEGDQLGKDG